jgi:prephenate dehydratase
MEGKVAIQGIKGSFHHQVASEYFGEYVNVCECLSFDKLADNLKQKNAHIGVMAIENSIAGSIIPNYAIIDSNNLRIIGEYYLNIHHNLMALPGQSIADIKEVHSHPMALLQCKDFFRKYSHIKLVEDVDTAETAQRIQDKKLKNIAAIASNVAAKLYKLDILFPEIQSIKNNVTRFVIVKTNNSIIPEEEINKASLKFQLDHKRGSLAAVLNALSDCRLSLTKIQSLPKIDTPWKYSFFVDVTFQSYAHFQKAKAIINIMADHFKVLGEYKNGRL